MSAVAVGSCSKNSHVIFQSEADRSPLADRLETEPCRPVWCSFVSCMYASSDIFWIWAYTNLTRLPLAGLQLMDPGRRLTCVVLMHAGSPLRACVSSRVTVKEHSSMTHCQRISKFTREAKPNKQSYCEIYIYISPPRKHHQNTIHLFFYLTIHDIRNPQTPPTTKQTPFSTRFFPSKSSLPLKPKLVGGFFTNPFKKFVLQIGSFPQVYSGEIKKNKCIRNTTSKQAKVSTYGFFESLRFSGGDFLHSKSKS